MDIPEQPAGIGNDDLAARLNDAVNDIRQLKDNNEKLVETLRDARAQIVTLNDEITRLTGQARSCGILFRNYPDGSADVLVGGQKLRVPIDPRLAPADLRQGGEVVVDAALGVVALGPPQRIGVVATIKAVIAGSDRVLVESPHDGERIVAVADQVASTELSIGDTVLVDPRSGFAYEQIVCGGVLGSIGEEVPGVTLAQLGGLDAQITEIKELVHRRRVGRGVERPGRGMLLISGPTGCGKTTLARAVADYHLASHGGSQAALMVVSCVELRSKFVGEAERTIATLFRRIREKAKHGSVVVLLDQMEAVFHRHVDDVPEEYNSGVPQLAVEIDRMVDHGDALLIGVCCSASAIDPAITRPGRTDLVIEIPRPDLTAASAIAEIYLDHNATRAEVLGPVIEFVYSKCQETEVARVSFADGTEGAIWLCDIVSGGLIQRLIDRARLTAACRRDANQQPTSVTSADCLEAARTEVRLARLLANDQGVYGQALIDTFRTPVASIMPVRSSNETGRE